MRRPAAAAAPEVPMTLLSVVRAGALVLVGLSVVAVGCVPRPGAAPPPASSTSGAASLPAGGLPALAESQGDVEAVKSRVTRVTVYSDRARITRQASVRARGDATVVAFRGLPGWVDDGTVQVATSGGRIVDVRVNRGFLASATDETWRRLEADHKALVARRTALQDEVAVLDAQKAQIEAIKAFSLDRVSRETTAGTVNVQTYGDVLRFISDALRSTAIARREVEARLDALAPEIEASQRRLDDARALQQLEETEVVVTLQAAGAPTVTVDLTYLLPGVTWEPLHEVRASSTGSGVEVASWAALTQTTGEDWDGAEIAFSTQSSTQAVRIPELEALTLGDTVTATRLLTSQVSSFTRAQSAFQGQNALWNRVHQSNSVERARSSFEQAYQSNLEYLQVVQGRTVQLFESLERRGTSVHFKAESSQGVRGDGHPVRLPIGRATLESTQRIVAAPEQSLNAARTLVLTNTTDQPLLPGRVSLYQDGAFVGLTDIDFVARGESFSLFLGVADHLKLSRELDRKQSSLVRRSRNLMSVAFVVTAENLGSTPTSFTLADRVPVSENKDIRVSQVSISPAVKPDTQGLLHWEITLKPGEKKEIRIAYQIEYPLELYIDTNRRSKSPAASPGAPRDLEYERSTVEEQIMNLEEML